MKRLLASLILLSVIALGIYAFQIGTRPPEPTVTVAQKSVQTTEGSYCWDGLLRAGCVDKAYTSVYHMGNKKNAVVVEPNSTIMINFDREPIDGTLEVEKWLNEDEVEGIDMNHETFTAPSEKGLYVYHIMAHWKQGGGSYAFSIKVE
ncbi:MULTISPECIES: hypothetical protein [unclassified Bacillus (in: firmicutes)]|uniref:hypothetical protein n=1 Tax=unclassified Bacillus (in: firmicutes) TaxID=185979 RepID=UPI0008E04DD7|nr:MULTISPECIES: hypothetical protein [unclassified Bacillus (in: firmicutes)]SFA85731.1 hypothetical protein SAMN02799634_10254 [Bacillus sp. UNCCL13]SFQ83512.1 hypothetical protein SAMN04488577_2173 [Bacillus sp. cl95]